MRNRLGDFCALAMVSVFMTALAFWPTQGQAQDKLKSMPGFEQYQKMQKLLQSLPGDQPGQKAKGGGKGMGKGGGGQGLIKSGALQVSWKEGGKAFEYDWGGQHYRFDFETGKAVPVGKGQGPDKMLDEDDQDMDPPAGGPQPQQRGRQAASATSPSGIHTAFYRDCNLWLSHNQAKTEMQVTKDGNEKGRIKYGIASWVYGEELAQKSAMWWSPNGKKIAFYRFDEGKVRDYYLPLSQSSLYPILDTEPYPKPGGNNPIAEVLVYDLDSWKTVQIDVRDGKPFENDVVGHYVYAITWSPDGKELLMHRTNRRQNILELVAADPQTGKCRVIVHDEWLPSWIANRPPMRYLNDNKRFIWTSESSGYKNFHLYSLEGKLICKITDHPFEVANIVRVDEKAGLLYYMARSGDNHMKLQLHRVGLDGKGDTMLTDPAFNHTIDLAPDGQHFIDVYQTSKHPPATRVVDAKSKIVGELAKSDVTRSEKLGLKPVELITYKAGDGQTDLHGMLHFPSTFDPSKKYPLLVSVYAGPNTNKAAETFRLPNVITEYGFLFAELDSRSASGRGKKFIDAIYLNLGVTEIDDQAAGVKSLWSRPYLDKNRVGIFGTSYGGYASALCILRHPDVFQAASASSPVTDYRHYDTIYTERYMWIPQENKKGYDAGSAMTYAGNLKGRLMLFYGTQDNNVHPSHTLALVKALQKAGKSFDLQVGPDQGHSGINQQRMMEFFIENLVMKP